MASPKLRINYTRSGVSYRYDSTGGVGTYISETSPDTSYGDSTECLLRTYYFNTQISSLLKFDYSEHIPSDSTFSDATLYLDIVNRDPFVYDNFYALWLTVPFTSLATFNTTDGTTAWPDPRYDSGTIGETTEPYTPGVMEIPLAVLDLSNQQHFNDIFKRDRTDYGFYLQCNDSSGTDIVSFYSFKNLYTLKYTAGQDGTILGDLTQTVLTDGSGTPVTAVPADSDYRFVSWSDNTTIGSVRTDTNVQADVDATAIFAMHKHLFSMLKLNPVPYGVLGSYIDYTSTVVVSDATVSPVFRSMDQFALDVKPNRHYDAMYKLLPWDIGPDTFDVDPDYIKDVYAETGDEDWTDQYSETTDTIKDKYTKG